MKKKIFFEKNTELPRYRLSSIKHNETFSPLLVHNSVAALPAPDGVPGSDLVLAVALATDVDHRGLHLPRILVSLHGNSFWSEILNIF